MSKYTKYVSPPFIPKVILYLWNYISCEKLYWSLNGYRNAAFRMIAIKLSNFFILFDCCYIHWRILSLMLSSMECTLDLTLQIYWQLLKIFTTPLPLLNGRPACNPSALLLDHLSNLRPSPSFSFFCPLPFLSSFLRVLCNGPWWLNSFPPPPFLLKTEFTAD